MKKPSTFNIQRPTSNEALCAKLMNAKGVPSFSPGLVERRETYPGRAALRNFQPQRGCGHFRFATFRSIHWRFLKMGAGRARRSARAANGVMHAFGLSGARGATRPTLAPLAILGRSESDVRLGRWKLKVEG
jgi:hypothetical protein